jgi:dTDP-4-amino-4,6-dideoxygalactose transaminase
VQLGKLDRFIEERDRGAAWYAEALADLSWLRVPQVPRGYEHAWQAYVTVVDEDAPLPRNEIMQRLHDRGVATRPGTHAVTELGVYRRLLGLEPGSFPVAARLERQTMAIPLHNRMTEDDFAYVAECLHDL